MLSTRYLARAVARASSKSSRSCFRTSQSVVRQPWRPSASIAQTVKQTACFSTSSPRLEGNDELSAKLSQELAIEQENPAQDEAADQIKGYLNASEFQLEDVEGSEEVHLVRTYNDEQIKVTFSTSGLSGSDEGEADAAMYDEPVPGESQDGRIRQAPEDELENEDYAEPQIFMSVDIQVSKPGKGALLFQTELDPTGQFYIKHVAQYPTIELAEAKTAEAQIAQRNLYTGPPFLELDESLQTLFDEFLKERGINEAMALFIPSYVDQKESQEYVRWLERIKKFVD